MNVEVVENNYKISFDYKPEYVNFCNQLQGSKYLPKARHWQIPRNVPNAIDLKSAGYFNDQDLLDRTAKSGPVGSFHWRVDATLYEYQKQWATWCAGVPKAMLVAEMGLGKTLMAMLWFKVNFIDPREILIVCPNSLIPYWVGELERFTGQQAIAVVGTAAQRLKAFSQKGIHVINYDYLASNSMGKEVSEKRSDARSKIWGYISAKKCVVFDESHKIKNPSSARSKTIHKMFKFYPRVLALTGTPVSQGAQDYYSQFKVINPTLLGTSFTAFKARYCVQEQIRGAPIGVKKIQGYRNLDELNNLIRPYTLTLLKRDCLDLPEKNYIVRKVVLSVEQREAYQQMHHEMLLWLQENRDDTEPVVAANILTRLLRLSQIVQGFIPTPEGKIHTFQDNPKIQALKDVLEDLPPGEGLVISYRFKEDCIKISALLKDLGISYSLINGDVPSQDRQNLANQFQRGEVDVILGEVRTMGVGFNLDRSSKMLFYSNDYSLVNRLQMEDRIHRATSKGDQCLYIDLVAQGTIDEEVLNAIRSKKSVAEELTQKRLNFQLTGI